MRHRPDLGRLTGPERPTAVRRTFLACCALALSLASTSACGTTSGGGMAAGAADTPTAGATQASSATPSAPAADCTKATKVMINERAGGTGDTYSFSPGTLTLMRGGFLYITNNSDESHALTATPDAGVVSTVLDKKERQIVQFPRAGSFTVESADPRHRAVLRLTVSGDSGCGTPTPTLTITGAGQYAFSPRTLTVVATQNFTVANRSDATHTVTCTPDTGGNGDNSTVDKGETQVLAFDKPGTYTCASTQHTGAQVTVTVTPK